MSDIRAHIDAHLNDARETMRLVSDNDDVIGVPLAAPIFNTIGALGNAIAAVIARHRPWGMYDECGHTHEPDDPGVVEIREVGYVCTEAHLFDVCTDCCTERGAGEYQSEWCVDNHHHARGLPWCLTVRDIAAALGERYAAVAS